MFLYEMFSCICTGYNIRITQVDLQNMIKTLWLPGPSSPQKGGFGGVLALQAVNTWLARQGHVAAGCANQWVPHMFALQAVNS